MANDLSKKSKPEANVEKPFLADQTIENGSVTSEDSPFTAEQRQILGNVYQLILSWRRERLIKTATPVGPTPSNLLPIEGEA